MVTMFTVDEQAKSVSQAEEMIAKHNEHKVSDSCGVLCLY